MAHKYIYLNGKRATKHALSYAISRIHPIDALGIYDDFPYIEYVKRLHELSSIKPSRFRAYFEGDTESVVIQCLDIISNLYY